MKPSPGFFDISNSRRLVYRAVLALVLIATFSSCSPRLKYSGNSSTSSSGDGTSDVSATVNFALSDEAFDEGVTTAAQSVSVTLSTALSTDLTVNYVVGNLTNLNPTSQFDLPAIGEITIPAGSTSAAIEFNTVGDGSTGLSGHLEILLTGTSSATVVPGARPSYHRFIREDDAALTDPFVKISAGKKHTCGMTAAGQVRCWGAENMGQTGGVGGGGGSGAPWYSPYHAFWGASSSVPDSQSYTRIFAGGEHGCGINLTNGLFCWGDNGNGQVGIGSTGGTATKTIVDSGTGYSLLALGAKHTCGITLAGELKCWGLNDDGQLGDGTTVLKNAPAPIDIGESYFSVSAGISHTCGITASGALKCWGGNAFGQLGNGTIVDSTTPIVIDPGTNYTWIAAGDYHTCATTISFELKCWGLNSFGQVGDGTTTTRTSPVVIQSGTSFRRIAAGSAHTCATLISGAGSTLRCWGWNQDGQLGDGTNFDQTSPTSIDTVTEYSEITAGARHTCGITTTGHTKCWGANDYGQLGSGYSERIGDGYRSGELSPGVMDRGTKYSKVRIAKDIGCGITTSGVLKCWGKTTGGLLGDGTNGDTYLIRGPTEIDPGVLYSDVDVSSKGSCGVTTAGSLKCWGPNVDGFIGNRTGVPSLTPTAVSASVYSKVAVTETHACAIITIGGKLECWGENDYGQLGLGYTSPFGIGAPANITDTDDFESVSVGSNQAYTEGTTCAITATGVLKCWGRNQYGPLGDGTTTDSSSSVVVDSGTSYRSVSAGNYRTCGVTTAGVLKCWGARSGIGLSTSDFTGCGINECSSPKVVDSGTGFSSITVQLGHACGLLTTGDVKCYGDNTYGQLANGTRTVSYSLIVADADTTYTQIDTAYEETALGGAVCGITTEGYIRCWGAGNSGSTGRIVSSNYPITIW